MNKFLISVLITVLCLSVCGCSPKQKSDLPIEQSISKVEDLKSISKKNTDISTITYKDYHEGNNETILLDKSGKEVSYEVLLVIDRKKEFGKDYMLIYPSNSADEDIELEAYGYVENEEGTGGDLTSIKTDAEWDMIEEVFYQFMD